MNSLTLSQRLMLGVIGPLVLVFAGLTAVVALQLNSALPAMHKQAAMENVVARSAEISRWLDGYAKWLRSLSGNPALRDGTLSGDEKNQWLKDHIIRDPAIDILFVTDRNGQGITQKDANPIDVGEREYFRTLMSVAPPPFVISQPVLSKSSGEPITVVAVPLRDERGQVNGVLGVALTMAELSVIANQLADADDPREFGWVVDNRGLMVAHPDKNLRMNLDITRGDEQGFAGMSALSRNVLSGNAGVGRYLRPDGDEYTVVYAPVSSTPGWVIGVSIPTESFTAASRDVLTRIIGLMLVAVLLLVAVLMWIARQMVTPIRRMVDMLDDIADGEGDLTQRLPVAGKDELAQLANGFNRFTARIQTLMHQVADTTRQLNASATSLQTGSNEMRDNVHRQQSEVDQIAAAMNEMESTVREVAAHAQTASNAAQEGNGQVREGSMRVGRVREVIAEQADTLRSTADEISALQESGNQIGQVMTVIRGIAEQTNLLALNAAIEAARAGDAGRGFAVVSDEVRQLASRTHESTRQIEQTVDALQERISRAVTAMHTSTERSQQSVSEAEAAHQALQAIRSAIDNIEGMNLQIAAATEEQSATAGELNRNLGCIVEVSNTTLQHTAGAASNIRELFAQAEALQASVGRFRL